MNNFNFDMLYCFVIEIDQRMIVFCCNSKFHRLEKRGFGSLIRLLSQEQERVLCSAVKLIEQKSLVLYSK